jgi:hypothetical protein
MDAPRVKVINMEWLWTWSGNSFGYRQDGELWTHDGCHIGRFRGHEIYGPDGFYLGELMREDRLVVDAAKKARCVCVPAFVQLPKTVKRHRGLGFNRTALPEGYGDFPRPAQLR